MQHSKRVLVEKLCTTTRPLHTNTNLQRTKSTSNSEQMKSKKLYPRERFKKIIRWEFCKMEGLLKSLLIRNLKPICKYHSYLLISNYCRKCTRQISATRSSSWPPKTILGGEVQKWDLVSSKGWRFFCL